MCREIESVRREIESVLREGKRDRDRESVCRERDR